MFWSKTIDSTKLTRSVSCAGCAAKLSPSLLKEAVFNLKQPFDPNLLVGFDKADDAGVYRLSEDLALVQTVDFFTPIVDDPYWYGQIAAANSLSDIYAMGGKPLTALNVICYPEEMGAEALSQILKGGLEKLKEAHCTLLGGHSVKDKETKFGMAITGTINPNRIFSNDKAKPGQQLVFTKKLGTGIVTTAAKAGKCPQKLLEEATLQMAALNDRAAEAMIQTRATSCTDVTGFSFLGHLSEMTRASQVRAVIRARQIPRFDGVESLIAKGFLTRGDKTNRLYAPEVKFENDDNILQSLLFDPQTSGGLLISMPPEDVSGFLKQVPGWVVGEIAGPDTKGAVLVTH